MVLYFQNFPLQSGVATVVLGLRLSWLDAHFREWDRVPGSRILLADSNGRILVRVPDNAGRTGLMLLEESRALLSAQTPGLGRVHDEIKAERFVGYVPASKPQATSFVLVTIPPSVIAADFFESEKRGFLVLGLGVLVAVVTTLIAGQRLIRSPTRALMEAARNWARGNLATRVAVEDSDTSEFGRISRALNDMASSMQRQVSARLELQSNLEARVAERTRDLLISRDQLQVALGEQAKSEASLRQAQKMQMVGQLAGGIAHDFNNLLTALIGALDLLRPRLPVEDKRSLRLVDNAMQSAERGARLTFQLLAFSRRQRLLPVQTDLNQIVEGMMELIGTTIGRDIRVSTELHPNLSRALVDPNQLEAGVLNLALNARDAMPKGGALILRTANLTLSEPQVALDGVTELGIGDYVTVSVQDSGTGMSGEVLSRVFEPFFTTKPPSQGSGLGLSQVHGLAVQSGGAVKIQTYPGVGTTVTLILPVAIESLPAIPRDQTDHGQRAMVVDDDDGVRALIGEMLSEMGYRPVLMSEPMAALACLEEAEKIDLLVADYAMPGMNGAELIDRAMSMQADLASILVTGHADLPSLARGVADADLPKPFTIASMVKAVQTAQRRRATRVADDKSLVTSSIT